MKATNIGQCINYKSICPERYKTGVIRTFLHRAYHVCSEWSSFYVEVQRIKQVLTNSNFPARVIDREVEKFIGKHIDQPLVQQDTNDISFFFENQMSATYKADEKKLKELFESHVLPVSESDRVKLFIYYKQRKLHNMFIRNNEHRESELENRHHVVYEYTCNEEGCHAPLPPTYIGYTTCTLYERFGQHASVKKHLLESHGLTRVGRRKLLESVRVLRCEKDRRHLIMMEAMLIKENRPKLNSQEEGSTRIIKIFKH